MSLDTITDVLLADGWHKVAGQSFDLDAYEFMWQGRMVLGGGTCEGVPSTGFAFITPDGSTLFGPLTSLLALKRAGKGTP